MGYRTGVDEEAVPGGSGEKPQNRLVGAASCACSSHSAGFPQSSASGRGLRKYWGSAGGWWAVGRPEFQDQRVGSCQTQEDRAEVHTPLPVVAQQLEPPGPRSPPSQPPRPTHQLQPPSRADMSRPSLQKGPRGLREVFSSALL
ncbi:unnamed protein product [Rangifer tarandus platyrhynchus]|uniref:Uncharacterized protein n=2 Tax=Rangifer tarandus platyrhynchus TaxID=3082113 RepID=A0AC59ZY24_RANTA|nr:unnamed protein product [Rangifer tarandus platyrhynchus]